MNMKVYIIRHKETGRIWSNGYRSVFTKAGAAKNSWNVWRRNYLRRYWSTAAKSFNDQDEFEVVECRLVEVQG